MKTKTMKTKTIAALALTALAGVSLVGCSTIDGPAPTAQRSEQPTTLRADTKIAEGIYDHPNSTKTDQARRLAFTQGGGIIYSTFACKGDKAELKQRILGHVEDGEIVFTEPNGDEIARSELQVVFAGGPLVSEEMRKVPQPSVKLNGSVFTSFRLSDSKTPCA